MSSTWSGRCLPAGASTVTWCRATSTASEWSATWKIGPTGSGSGSRFPTTCDRYVVEKGSITIDGVSLTVAAIGSGWLEVALIPHTLEVTNLGLRLVGDQVNLEVDILAKYVEKLLKAGT